MYEILIELEIIRYKIYYKLFKILKEKLRSKKIELGLKELKQIILRYILNKKADLILLNEESIDIDPVFDYRNSEIANKQLYLDIKYFKLNESLYDEIKNILENSFKLGNDLINDLKKNDKIQKDNEIININNKLLVYSSNSLKLITDNYIKVFDNKIELPFHYNHKYLNDNTLLNKDKIKYTFCSSLRYKYLYIDAHSSQLNYKENITKLKDISLDDATECFGSCFNHQFNNYCSPFSDLEMNLGSLGNFFKIKKFPTKILLINPVYDVMIIYLTIKKALELLDEYEHTIYFILPAWSDLDYSPLYKSRHYKNKMNFLKGTLMFFNAFTNRIYPPCNIEIILLKSN
jgi:hypothetical protein